MADVLFTGFETIDMIKARLGWKPSDEVLKFHDPVNKDKSHWCSIADPLGDNEITAAVTTKYSIAEIKAIYKDPETKNRVGIGYIDYQDGKEPVRTLYVRGERKVIDAM